MGNIFIKLNINIYKRRKNIFLKISNLSIKFWRSPLFNTDLDCCILIIFSLCLPPIYTEWIFVLQDLVLHLFDALFALPSPKQRYLPKCKSPSVRSAAYDLLVEMLKGSFENYLILHEKLLLQNTPGTYTLFTLYKLTSIESLTNSFFYIIILTLSGCVCLFSATKALFIFLTASITCWHCFLCNDL